MEYPRFIVEKVPCCICHGTGKAKWLWLFKRKCRVCDGAGVREIIVPVGDQGVADRVRSAAALGVVLGSYPATLYYPARHP